MIEFPEIVPQTASINLVSNAKEFISPFNNSAVTYGFSGARWVMSLSFSGIDNVNGVDEIDILQSFIWSLDGLNGRFLCRPFGKPGFVCETDPFVSADESYGKLMQTDGWPKNQLAIKRGSFFSVNNELKITDQDCYADDIGRCALKFSPALRNSPPRNSQIVTYKPKGIFMLSDNEQGSFNLEPGLSANLTLDIKEVINYV